jgi:hypothetical protein
MTTTHIKASEFTNWFAKAKPSDSITYYSGPSFVAACEEDVALFKLRDAIWAAGFEKSPRENNNSIQLIDKNTLHLFQRRIGPRPEGNAVGIFEYIAGRRRGLS